MLDIIGVAPEVIEPVLDNLLFDISTRHCIIFATDDYVKYDKDSCQKTSEITKDIVLNNPNVIIQSRAKKRLEEQKSRTKGKAEVFTPSWICNKMNNLCDAAWFECDNVFNIEKDKSWETVTDEIIFQKGKIWKDYVSSNRLEITCGEAPYIVSRYDTSTGEIIPVKDRIGFLDRKLRIVGENTKSMKTWLKWVCKAFQSVYGFEYQGDNLLIARINILMTFVDYMQDRWNRTPSIAELTEISNIIKYNFWQMDGLTDCVPLYNGIKSLILDWNTNELITFESLKQKQ